MIQLRIPHLLLFTLLGLCNTIGATSLSPEDRGITNSSKAKRKIDGSTEDKLAKKISLYTQVKVLTPEGMEWAQWVNASAGENLLFRIMQEYKQWEFPLQQLQKTGMLYFQKVAQHRRLYSEVNGQIVPGALYRTLQERSLVSTPIKTHHFDCNTTERDDALRSSPKNDKRKKEVHSPFSARRREFAQELDDTIMPSVEEFRPYAIALVLGNCLWSNRNIACDDATLTTKELTTLWAKRQRDCFALVFEKLQFIQKAYEIYENSSTEGLPIPSLDGRLSELIHDFPIQATSDLKTLMEDWTKKMMLEDAVISILKTHRGCLKNNKLFDLAAETHKILIDVLETCKAHVGPVKEIFDNAQKSKVDKNMQAERQKMFSNRQKILSDKLSEIYGEGTPRSSPLPPDTQREDSAVDPELTFIEHTPLSSPTNVDVPMADTAEQPMPLPFSNVTPRRPSIPAIKVLASLPPMNLQQISSQPKPELGTEPAQNGSKSSLFPPRSLHHSFIKIDPKKTVVPGYETPPSEIPSSQTTSDSDSLASSIGSPPISPMLTSIQTSCPPPLALPLKQKG